MPIEGTHLQHGTYLRERDGATRVLHNELTSWNFPHTSVRENPELWRHVTDSEELRELWDWAGSGLLPGEYISVQSAELLDIAADRLQGE